MLTHLVGGKGHEHLPHQLSNLWYDPYIFSICLRLFLVFFSERRVNTGAHDRLDCAFGR